MPSLRRVPRIYHLRSSAANPVDEERDSTTDTTTSLEFTFRSSQSPFRTPLPPGYHGSTLWPLRSESTRSPVSKSPHQDLPWTRSKRRVLHDPPSPILCLPAEILYRIGQFLEPPLNPEHWSEAGIDLIQYSSTCRAVRHATVSLIGRHFGFIINDSPGRDFVKALTRLDTLLYKKANECRKIRKIFVKDDLPLQPETQQARMNWHQALGASLMQKFPNVEMFAYVRDLDQATQESPYDTLPLGIEVMQGLAVGNQIKTVYLCGVHFTCWSPDRLFRPILPSSLNVLHLVAVHDSMLPLIKLCPGLTSLRIWRDFMIGFSSVHNWFGSDLWVKLEELQISGFYGNEVMMLQATLKESRRIAGTTYKDPILLKTLDLDEPYATNDLLGLLTEFSSKELRVLRLTFWKDAHFKPMILERIAEMFPMLEELKVTLESIQCRWWPHKVDAWALSLSKLSRLKVFKWNCIPYHSSGTYELKLAMRSQAVVLANALQSLELVGYVDREEYLDIQRNNGRLVSVRWISRSADHFSILDHDLGLIKNDDQTHSSSNDPSNPFLAPPGFLPPNLNFAARCLSPSDSVTKDSFFDSSSEV
ncbi:hypothetical protein DFH28DRAFT_966412 [Melampsora americana]|nr:hypothetical protein DFH28DRAFT_966412 [Melampsora americana]